MVRLAPIGFSDQSRRLDVVLRLDIDRGSIIPTSTCTCHRSVVIHQEAEHIRRPILFKLGLALHFQKQNPILDFGDHTHTYAHTHKHTHTHIRALVEHWPRDGTLDGYGSSVMTDFMQVMIPGHPLTQFFLKDFTFDGSSVCRYGGVDGEVQGLHMSQITTRRNIANRGRRPLWSNST